MPQQRISEVLKELLGRGHWYTPYEMQGYIEISLGRRISESAITARIRELRPDVTVKSQQRPGHTAWEYTIPTNQQQEA